MDPDHDNQPRRDEARSPVAGGIFIMIALIVGIIAGLFLGQPSVGMVSGLLAGIAIAVAIWLIDRRRA